MLHRLFLACLLTCLAALPGRAETLRFEQDGLERYFALTIPDGLDAPAPLILVLHGVLENEAQLRRVTRGRFDALAREYGFVVAYPSAFLKVWNIGEGEGAASLLPYRDDLAYLERVIAEVRARAPIDSRRIFVAGFSQGGMMTYALACKRPGLIRAITTVSMGLPTLLADDCTAHPPQGASLIHGTADHVVAYEGGPVISGLNGVEIALMSHAASVDFFTRRLGCTAPEPERIYDTQDDGTRVIRRVYRGCPGRAVEDYVIEGGGHTWPDGAGFVAQWEPVTREIDGASAAWGFFSRFR